MAEVNAFSIDGAKYQLTATDQTYVGETGLAQLGLDYTCTPDEMNQALADAGGGTVLVDGHELYSAGADGWDFGQDSTNEDSTAQGVVCMRSAGALLRSRLWLYGRADTAGIRTRGTTSGEDATYDGTEWAILMYGRFDTWSPDGSYIELAGRWNGAGTSAVVTIPLGAPVAPGVTSATCTTAGTAYVYNVDGDGKTVTSTSKHSLAITRAGLVDTIGTISSIGSSSTPCVVQLPSSFTVTFS